MRTALLLPLSAALVASAGLALPSSPLTRLDSVGGASSSTSAPAAAPEPSPPELPDAYAASAITRQGAPEERSGVTTTPDGSVPGGRVGLRGRWTWPLSPRPVVERPFVRPSSTYGAGHRGVDLSGAGGQAVLAVDAGTVTHVGRIAGRGTVTVLHASGVRSTYEPVTATVTTGQAVTGGSRIGLLATTGSHCATACLHLGAVRGKAYLDPLVFLVGGRRVRLLPLVQAPDG